MSNHEPCPSAETLAAYLDGKLPPAERSEIEKHVANCEECFEQLAGAAAFQAANAEAGVVVQYPRAQRQPVRWYVAAAASVAMLAIGLWSTARQRPLAVRGAPDALAWAERLGGAEELEAAAARAWNEPGGALAFGGGVPAAKRAFRLGVYLLDARVALDAQQHELLVAALDRAAILLPREGDGPRILERLRSVPGWEDRRLGDFDQRSNLNRLAALARTIDATAFELGVWVEAGRLAALGGRTDLLNADFAERLDATTAARPAADPAVAQEVDSIRGEFADRRISPEELPDLARSFERLLLLN